MIIGDANQAFLSQVGEDLSKYTSTAIMNKVNHTANNSTEVVEEAAYGRTISTSGTEVIDQFTGADLGSPCKRLKIFVPPDMETILDPVISRFIAKLQAYLNHSPEVIVGYQASISLLNSKIGDVPLYYTTIWCVMGDIMKNLVSHVAILDNLDLEIC